MAVGLAPTNGPQLIDGTFVNGITQGSNQVYQSGLVAAGSAQATALQLGNLIAVYEVDTTAASTGVALPAALAGSEISIYNNGANTLTVYPQIANNATTGSQDTINNASSVTLATHVGATYKCAKNGVWFSC
jgi:hypothetical protein